MLFRIIAPHTHQASSGGETFTCYRKAVMVDQRLEVTWSAYHGEQLLKDDCRTLNEAKNVCRKARSPNDLARG